MDKGIKMFVVILVVVVGIFLVLAVSVANKLDEERDLGEQQTKEFIDSCVNDGGKINQVGSVWTGLYFVCENN